MSHSTDKIISVDTDFHSHLLPDLDCSSHPDVVSELIRTMSEAGIKNIVLTPHFYPHRHSSVRRFIERRDGHLQHLIDVLNEKGIPVPEFFPAAEVLLFPGLENFEDLGSLCIKNTRTLLIEMPDPPWVSTLYDTLYDIKKLGYDIVIAHAERYGKNEAESLIRRGYRIQLNADSICAHSTKRLCSAWANGGYVYAIGSDTHVGREIPHYKKMHKASAILSECCEHIEKRMHKLIGID